MELPGLGEVAGALRLLKLDPRSVELLLDLGLAGDLLLFRLPAGGELCRLLLEIGQFLLERLESFLRCGVVFLLQRLAFDFQLDDPPVEIFDLSGLDSTSIRILLAASSIRSIALSGRKRSVM